MATATLTTPLTLNPQQAVTLVVRQANIDFGSRTVHVFFDLLDASGNILERRNITADAASVATYVSNQETTIYNALLAKLGITGTVG